MKRVAAIALCLLVAVVLSEIPRACVAPYNNYPFCNPNLPVDQRVNNLISLLQTSEKPPLLTARFSPGGGVPRIGLPAYDWGANCQHGVQSRCKGNTCPTSFPCNNALGATFNASLIEKIGSVIGNELRALWLQGVGENHPNNLPAIGLDCWSPNININRDPRWGRNQEVPSEDPYWTGIYAIAYTKGLQNGPDPKYLQAVVTLKHWAAYSVDRYDGVTRHNYNAVVAPYDLANTYFPAWKAVVTQANPKGVMCSYNALNGVPTCADQFLNNTLRGTYQFDGYVTSDTGAVEDIFAEHHYVRNLTAAAAVAITAGTDINSGSVYKSELINALNQGYIKESDIDLALFRTLKLRFELGLFDPIDKQPYWHVPLSVVNSAPTQAFNRFSTLQSMVLLKNDKNTLPFPKGKTVAVIGPHGNSTGALLGNYLGQICPASENDVSCVQSPYLAIKALNLRGNTIYVHGASISGTSKSEFPMAVNAAKEADFVVLLMGLNQSVEREDFDRTSITLPGVQEELAQLILAVGKPTALVLVNGGAVAIDNLKDSTPAIVEAFYPGFYGGSAIASVLFGDYNPGGKLPFTMYPANYTNQVKFLSMSMTDAPGRSYRYYSGPTLYPFGYGLSYTTFEISVNNPNEIAYLKTTDMDTKVQYTVKVTNTGNRAGDEVVFAYQTTNVTKPLLKQLYGFQRVHLNPGQSTTISFTLDLSVLQTANESGDKVVYPGEYQLIFTNGVSETETRDVLVVGPPQVVEKYPFQ